MYQPSVRPSQRSLRRLVSGVAIVATASAVLVAPTANAQSRASLTGESQTVRLAATSLSIRVVDARIKPGHDARISGHLAVAGGATAAGRTVLLEAKALGTTEFVPVAEVVSAARGGVSTIVEPEVTTRYRWRYLGDTDTRPSRSGVAAVRVRTTGHAPHRLASSLSIRHVFRVSALGGIDIVRGRLRVGRVSLPHRPVILLARAAGTTDWTYEGTRNTHRKGTVKFVVDPSVDTAYRMVFLGSRLLRPARSAVVRVPHRPDVAITVAPSSITRGETVTITGSVTDVGLPVAGAKVVLWAQKFGRPADARRIAEAGITAEDGSVVFTDVPRRSTKYRLRVVGGEDFAPALSAIAGVVVAAVSS